MNRFILFTLLTVLVVSCRQEIVLTEDQIPEDVFVPEKEVDPFTGVCKIFYMHTQKIHYLFNYEKGILNGPFKFYDKSGQIQTEGSYLNGELEGEFVRYDADGKLADKYVFRSGKRMKNS